MSNEHLQLHKSWPLDYYKRMHLVLGSRSERGGARRASTKRVLLKNVVAVAGLEPTSIFKLTLIFLHPPMTAQWVSHGTRILLSNSSVLVIDISLKCVLQHKLWRMSHFGMKSQAPFSMVAKKYGHRNFITTSYQNNWGLFSDHPILSGTKCL